MKKNKSLFTCPNCGSGDIDLTGSETNLKCRNCGFLFPRIKVFFSYKHDCYTDQILLIRDHLTSAGFDVWIDHRIKPLSESWRNQLREAIVESDFVISFISAHYFDSAVCKDELCIAVCNIDNGIRIIFLDKQEDLKDCIPDFLSDPQWYDISDWIVYDSKDKMKSRDRAKEARFAEIVRTIARELVNPENNRKKADMSKLKKVLAPQEHLARPDLASGKDFCGRTWLYDRCEDWRRNGNEHALLLYGPPGIGKSTFVLYYGLNNPYAAAVFFCKHENRTVHTAGAIIRTIAYQLADSFPEYRGALADLLLGADSQEPKPEMEEILSDRAGIPSLFRFLITEPLMKSAFSDHKERYIVLIDTLNEMLPDELELLSKAFSQELHHLPEWLCFLFTSLPTDDVRRLFGFVPESSLSSQSEENILDIRLYADTVLARDRWAETQRGELVDQICQKSEGIFLYASFVVKALNSGSLQIEGSSYNSLPSDLNYAISGYISRIVSDKEEFDRKYRDILSMICASPEPLPVKYLGRILSLTKSSLEDRLARFAPFLSRQTIDNTDVVSLAYQYYYLWFGDRNLSRIYYCAEEDGANLLASLFLTVYDQKDYDHMSPYMLRNFLTILEQCEDDRPNDLYRVIDDTRFLRYAAKRLFDLGLISQSNQLCSGIIRTVKRLHRPGSYVTQASLKERLAMNYINQGKVNTAQLELLSVEKDCLPCIQGHFALKVSILSNIAWTARENNDLPLADLYLQKSLEMAEHLDNSPEAVEARGAIHYVEGCILYKKYRAAEGAEKEAYYTACKNTLEESVRIWRSLEENDNLLLQITFSHMTIGWLYLVNGESRNALAIFREIYQIREKMCRENLDNPYIAKALLNIANACVRIAEEEKDSALLKEAAEACDRAIAIYRKISDVDMIDYNVAIVMITKGDILVQQNDKEGAVLIYRKALEILNNYNLYLQNYIQRVTKKLAALQNVTDDDPSVS